MTGTSPAGDRGNPIWSLVFRVAYRVVRLLTPLIHRSWRSNAPGLDRVVELDLVGRRTGRARPMLVTLLSVDGVQYVGHPNGASEWTRNLEAAGSVRVVEADGSARTVRPIRLTPGPERESVVRATRSQQPFPASLLYSAGREHVRRVGVYFRLESPAQSAAARTEA